METKEDMKKARLQRQQKSGKAKRSTKCLAIRYQELLNKDGRMEKDRSVKK